MKFNSNYHLHVGYYEDENDIEVTVYKILDEDKWIVFLDENQSVPNVEEIINHYDLYPKYGYMIFSVEVDEITYELVYNKLIVWLKENSVI